MRAVIQRVTTASVTVSGAVVGAINIGYLVYLGVAPDDTDADAAYVAQKIADLRLFDSESPDTAERSLTEIGGAVLLVSQFTLMGDCRKGRRSSWSNAAKPQEAIQYYDAVQTLLQSRGITVATGVFRADMLVTATNEGPFTVLLDSKKQF